MNNRLTPFPKPIYITRPLLPPLSEFNGKLKEIWDSQWLTNNGQQHRILEKRLSEYLKVPHLSLFNNGTIALITAVQSLRLSGEVITTPFTFPATPHVLTWNGVTPVFCDIEEETLTIDADKIESMITPHTTGILGVHVFGNPCNVLTIQDIANRYGLKVIYDSAHAFGTEIHKQGIGNFGDISMFSFHATKLFHTAEGGALTFNNEYLKERIDFLKNFGIKNEEEVIMPGINGKMNEIQAGLGLLMLDYIEEERENRNKVKNIYINKLKNVEGITLLNDSNNFNDYRESYQYFVIRIEKEKFGKSRDYVYNRFQEFNVYTRKYFYPLCSDYTCYRQLPSSSKENLPIANKIVNEVLCFPYYGRLTKETVEKICDLLISFREE